MSTPTSTFSFTIASPGGFRKGQIIPVLFPDPLSKPTAVCLIGFGDEVRIEGLPTTDGFGKRRRSGTNKERGWEAVSGTFKVESVSRERLAFSVRGVRFRLPEYGRGAATGSFVMQGQGAATFNESD